MRLHLVHIAQNIYRYRKPLVPLLAIVSALTLLGLFFLLFAFDLPTAHSAPLSATPPPFSPDASWFANDGNDTRSVAWGDMDGDGDLDLASGDQNGIRYYVNEGQRLNPTAQYIIIDGGLNARTVSWGDGDGDGDLDLAVGTDARGVYVYRNDPDRFRPLQIANGAKIDRVTSVAWGDMDGNGALDLAVGNAPSNLTGRVFVYTNTITANGLNLALAYTSMATHTVQSLAWGDVDRDGDLDLAVGNKNGANAIYKNESGQLSAAPAWESTTARDTRSLAWGDIDGDGTLELVVGNYDDHNEIYTGLGTLVRGYSAPTTTHSAAAVTFPLTDTTTSVALADVNGDGTLDLAVGNNYNDYTYIYLSPSKYPSPTNLSLITNTSVTSLNITLVGVAWGDVNGDGSPDLAAAILGANAIFINQSDPRPCTCLPTDLHVTSSAAWGDVDNDGDLDLARGMYTPIAPNLGLLINTGGVLITTTWNPQGVMTVTDVAWGDMNGDRYIDLAVATLGANLVFINVNGSLATSPAWQSVSISYTTSLAWGDVDGDGDLDLAVGNRTDGQQPQLSELYLNDGEMLGSLPAWTTPDAQFTMDVAWGDVDGDGDLDLAEGNLWSGTRIYLNQNGQLATTLTDTILLNESGNVLALAWGDMDGDGDLDLAIAPDRATKNVYRNDDGKLTEVVWSSLDLHTPVDIAWADVNEDGNLDLVVTYPQGIKIYRNLGGTLERTASSVLEQLINSQKIAIGDINQDGALDIAVARGNFNIPAAQPDSILLGQRIPTLFPITSTNRSLRMPSIYIDPALARADGYASPQVHESRAIPISYTLYIPTHALTSTASIQAFYSLNGGGTWYTATATSSTKTSNLLAFHNGQAVQHLFTWDVYASDFFGKSDNVVVRLVAQPDLRPLPNTMAGNYQWGRIAARTYPFRVRGTQVRVMKDGAGTADALVYRISAGQKSGGVMVEETGSPLRTDGLGYLSGRGRLVDDDQLVALLPITQTPRYTLYRSSAEVTVTGLIATPVITPGVIELDVSADRPLMLFNLTVSLEWDARKDTIYLAQLEADIQRASELIFDASNGQTALGDVTIYYAGEQWEEADLRIHATNRLRPHALIGGSVDAITAISLTSPTVNLAFAPGHIEMPASWNRFGESSGSLGEDWSRALAHEFGHYYFFLLEDYLGMNAAGLPAPVTTCPSLMGNVYLDENSEFHPVASWGDSGTYNCGNTLQQQTLGRSDWGTITAIYSWLKAPAQSYGEQNPGPSTLPLAVTQIRHVTPLSPPVTLDVPAYYLTKPDGSRYLASSSARAFRFHRGNLTDLGEPLQDRLQAWGAGVNGERVCVFDMNPDAPAVGCTAVQNGVSLLAMQPQTDWLPDIVLSPVSTNTLTLAVSNVNASAALRAQIYASDRPVTTTLPDEIVLQYDSQTGVFRATLPVYLEAYLRLWDASNPSHELVTDFTLSGAPTIDLAAETTLRLGSNASYTDGNDATHPIDEGAALQIGNGTALQIGNGTALLIGNGTALLIGNGTALQIGNGTTFVLGSGAALQIGNGTALQIGNGTALLIGNGTALLIGNGTTLQIGNGTALQIGNGTAQLLADGNGPVLSSDGQVILYVDSLRFAPGQFYTLQPATRVANPPTWATVVGQPYRLAASPGAPAIAGSSLSFRYLGRDVPPGEENFLKIFYFDEANSRWLPLETTLDTVQNSAAALAPGPGLYVLMSTIPVVLPAAGWNLFGWPVQGTRPITEALASIEGSYGAVYGYESTDPAHPWRFFSPVSAIPDTLDNLHKLEFGRGYWIAVTQPITLYLKGSVGEIRLGDPREQASLPQPPATLYGEILADGGAEIQPGTVVQAWIDGQLCGAGATWQQGGEVIYGLHVAAASQMQGCGQPGRTVTLWVGEAVAETSWPWTTGGLHRLPLPLAASLRLFIPQVSNEQP